jgi:16S rRNA (guanine(966)-N(2))-methyltransferase RsmD
MCKQNGFNTVRIIAGSAGGRKIKVPKGFDVRPTTDRVREALFSYLGSRVDGAKVLDLFGGSGALGIESLSRGAETVLFAEYNRKTALNLKQNISTLGFEKSASVITGDALTFLKKNSCKYKYFYDLVFIDPPYRTGLLEQAARLIASLSILAKKGLIVAEHPSDEQITAPAGMQVIKKRKYGNTSITFIEWSPDIPDT